MIRNPMMSTASATPNWINRTLVYLAAITFRAMHASARTSVLSEALKVPSSTGIASGRHSDRWN
jgi:hypothetical protein